MKNWYLTPLFLLMSCITSAQFTTLAIQDFDTIQTPIMGYTVNPAMTFRRGQAPANADIPNTPYGINNSWAWYSEGGDLTVTFDNVNITGFDTAFITFKLAALFDVDAGDYVTVSISTNGGTTWYDRVKINGTGSNCSWAYNATGVVDHLFQPVNTPTVYTPPLAGISPVGPSTVTIRVPNTTNQVRVKIRQRESTSSEGYFLDDLAVKVKAATMNNVAVSAITAPSSFCAGSHDVKVKVSNRGSSIINYVTVNWSVNGAVQTPYFHSFPIDTTGGTGAKDTVLTLGNLFFAQGSNTALKVWTSDPNGTTDPFPQDDTLSVNLKPSLNGSYNVGGITPDYATLAAAVTDLNAFGVCGPVTFNVAPGTYTGQLSLNYIPGASYTNTVNFEGANAATTIITSNSSAAATVLLTESKYVTFRNFTINNTATSTAAGIALIGSTLKCAVKSCIFNFTSSGVTYAINVTGNIAGYGAANNFGDSVLVDSNIINKCAYAIYVTGNAATPSNIYNRDLRITNNTINRATNTGIYISSVYNPVAVMYNNINMDSVGSASGYGMNISGCVSNHPFVWHEISHNTIRNAGAYGISLSGNTNNSGNPARIYNNMIGGGFRSAAAYGLYISESTSSPSLIYNNSVNLDFNQSSSESGTFSYTGSASTKIRNNIFAYTAPGGVGIPAIIAGNILTGNIDNNIYYNGVGPTLIKRNGTSYNASGFRTAMGGGDSSYNRKPAFVSAKNLHSSDVCLTGTNLSSFVTKDIDGDPRGSAPMIGADESFALSEDVSAEALSFPAVPITAGFQDIILRVKNRGNTFINSFTVSYSLNNGPVVSQVWSGLLNPCDTVSVQFNVQANLGAANNLVLYTSQPNWMTDNAPANDTLKVTLYAPLNGTYTIGSSPSDFTGFGAAASALKGGGISGNVVFEVKTGTYYEALAFYDAIKGTSDSTTVTFRSQANHRDSVLLIYSTSTSTTVTLSDINNISFRNMTLEANNADFGRVVEIAGSSSNLLFEGCKIKGPVSGSYENIFANNATGRKITFRNNIITDGSAGIYFEATSTAQTDSIIIEGNTITNTSSYGVYLNYNRNSKIRNNNISGAVSYALYTYYSYDALEVTGNTISTTGTYGLYSYYSLGAGLVANNNIRVTGNYGIRSQNSSLQKFYNNTVRTTGTYGVYISCSGSSYTGNEWKNNVIYTSSTSATAYAALITSNTNNIFDYNLYYNGGANLFSTYPTLAAYRAANPLFEIHSISTMPSFASPVNSAPDITSPASWHMNGRGVQTSLSTDINGNPRSTTLATGAPDLGAFEFTPSALPAAAVANPALPAAGTTQSFTVLNDTVATISWDMFAQVPSSITLRFFPGQFAPATDNSQLRTNCYWDIDESGPGSYNYTLNLYYKDPMKGTVAIEEDMRLAKKHAADPWTWYTGAASSTDVFRNILTAPLLSTFSVFTGTDNTSPLPVDLLQFDAKASGNDVQASWSTAMEKNTSYFTVEFSVDGKRFTPAGEVKAQGTSSAVSRYALTHRNAWKDESAVLYYRLSSHDNDGTVSCSDIVTLHRDDAGNDLDRATLLPNPFSRDAVLSILSPAGGSAQIEITDIHGRIISGDISRTVHAGTNTIVLEELNVLKDGIYFVRLTCGTESKVMKIVKSGSK